MSKFKIVGMIVLIAFAMGIFLVSDAVAAETGKVASRTVFYVTTFHTLKVPDVEGHAITLLEAKGISFSEKWRPALTSLINSLDLIKGVGTFQAYGHTTFPDGSITAKFEGKTTATGGTLTGMASNEGTWTYTKGTGKFEGIQGRGTFKSYILGPGQFYSEMEGEYTLP
jgi:hypothetical protein